MTVMLAYTTNAVSVFSVLTTFMAAVWNRADHFIALWFLSSLFLSFLQRARIARIASAVLALSLIHISEPTRPY